MARFVRWKNRCKRRSARARTSSKTRAGNWSGLTRRTPSTVLPSLRRSAASGRCSSTEEGADRSAQGRELLEGQSYRVGQAAGLRRRGDLSSRSWSPQDLSHFSATDDRVGIKRGRPGPVPPEYQTQGRALHPQPAALAPAGVLRTLSALSLRGIHSRTPANRMSSAWLRHPATMMILTIPSVLLRPCDTCSSARCFVFCRYQHSLKPRVHSLSRARPRVRIFQSSARTGQIA